MARKRKKRTTYKVSFYCNGRVCADPSYTNAIKWALYDAKNERTGHTLAVVYELRGGRYKRIARYMRRNGKMVRVRLAKKAKAKMMMFIPGRRRKKRSDAGVGRIGKKKSNLYRELGRKKNAGMTSFHYGSKKQKRASFKHKSRGGRKALYTGRNGKKVFGDDVYNPLNDPYAY